MRTYAAARVGLQASCGFRSSPRGAALPLPLRRCAIHLIHPARDGGPHQELRGGDHRRRRAAAAGQDGGRALPKLQAHLGAGEL